VIAQRIGLVSLVVDDYDDALAFFIGKLGFALVEDTLVPEQSSRLASDPTLAGDTPS
jgi:catechol 2,3-dioxygenase-like lactoylglutathione lyase family enzyme